MTQPDLGLEVGQFSDAGRQRSNNEDWLGKFVPVDAERLATKGSLFLVADGMGGHQSGELASRYAVDQAIRSYVEDSVLDLDIGESLRRAIQAANATLYAEASRRKQSATGRGWGTTLVAAVVCADALWIANVGDSRAYLLRDNRMRQLSQDHTLAAQKLGVGVLGGVGPGSHVITRALGRKPTVEVDVFPPVGLRPGDRVLLCSDGLTTPLRDDEICKVACRRSPQKAAELLVQFANERGGPDNVTVLLVEVSGQAKPPFWRGASDIWQTVTDAEFWQRTVKGLQESIPGNEQQGRFPVFLVVVALVILGLLGLGFVLGLLIF